VQNQFSFIHCVCYSHLTVFTSKHFVVNGHYKQAQSFCKLKNHNLIYLDEIPTTFITTVYHRDCYATDVLACTHACANTYTHTNTSSIVGTIYANGVFTHFWQIW